MHAVFLRYEAAHCSTMDHIFAVNQVLTLSSLSLNEINASNPTFPIGTLTTTTTTVFFV